MKLELYQRVALRHDLPEHCLQKGDVAMLVDYVPHASGGDDGYILEIFNAVGESIVVVAVPSSTVELLRADEVLTVRPLAMINS